jgi:hypothetical protein
VRSPQEVSLRAVGQTKPLVVIAFASGRSLILTAQVLEIVITTVITTAATVTVATSCIV